MSSVYEYFKGSNPIVSKIARPVKKSGGNEGRPGPLPEPVLNIRTTEIYIFNTYKKKFYLFYIFRIRTPVQYLIFQFRTISSFT